MILDGRRLVRWARARSLWYFVIPSSCCGDETLAALGCRYDMERFGCVRQPDPLHADLLIVSGAVTPKAAPEIRAAYSRMRSPKYVMAVGACACGDGPFASEDVLPIDVYVPGCPPRPEAILSGILALQEKILERDGA